MSWVSYVVLKSINKWIPIWAYASRLHGALLYDKSEEALQARAWMLKEKHRLENVYGFYSWEKVDVAEGKAREMEEGIKKNAEEKRDDRVTMEETEPEGPGKKFQTRLLGSCYVQIVLERLSLK